MIGAIPLSIASGREIETADYKRQKIALMSYHIKNTSSRNLVNSLAPSNLQVLRYNTMSSQGRRPNFITRNVNERGEYEANALECDSIMMNEFRMKTSNATKCFSK